MDQRFPRQLGNEPYGSATRTGDPPSPPAPGSGAPDSDAPGWRRWTRPQSLRAGLGSGLVGGICCIGSAIATAAGLGAAGFLATVMQRYQLYFILASLLVMGIWLTPIFASSMIALSPVGR